MTTIEILLQTIPGKIFSYCDMKTRKALRFVCQSFALEVDVHTGLSVMMDDRFKRSFKMAQSVKVTKMNVYNLRWFNPDAPPIEKKWLYDPDSFRDAYHVSLKGFIYSQWVLDCLCNLENLTSLYIKGNALDTRLLPPNTKVLQFKKLEYLEISTLEAKPNVDTSGVRRKRHFYFNPSLETDEMLLEDGTTIRSGSGSYKLGGKGRVKPLDVENSDDLTPVADNVYYLLDAIHSPNLMYFRMFYDHDLHNLGSLNWKTGPLSAFIRRHATTLRQLTLDGEENDQVCINLPRNEILPVPKLRHIFVNILDMDSLEEPSSNRGVIPYLKHMFTLKRFETTNLWKEILRRQNALESLHCSIHALWAWEFLRMSITRSYHSLQVINIGCYWHDTSLPFDMSVIGQCFFLKKFTFTISSPHMSELDYHAKEAERGLEEERRCRIINLSSIISCIFLESVFICHALCETEELSIFTELPNLTSLVLMYAGRMTNYGVTVGILEDFLTLRSLNLLLVVEFYRQKHSTDAYKLKRIIRSSINNRNCPIVSLIAPYSSYGKYVYVGDITEVTDTSGPLDYA